MNYSLINRYNSILIIRYLKTIIQHICVGKWAQTSSKKELNSTVWGLLKALFNDDVLKEYVGQKKKKIFCSLRSCAIIFGE